MNVSVVVCTYNRADSLQHTLDGLARQEIPAGLDWEVVVVDNNSTDHTSRVIETFAAKAPMIVRPVFEPRQGVSWARNAGFAQAKGDVIASTDDDVSPQADWLSSALRAMKEFDADLVGGRILPKWAAPPPAWLGRSPDLMSVLALMDYEGQVRLTATTRRPRLWTCNLAVSRNAVNRIGGFDTGLGRRGEMLFAGEDTDFFERALGCGFSVVYDSRLVVWHRVPPDRMRRSYFRRWSFQNAEGVARHRGRPTGRQLLGVSLFSYRWAATRLGAWLLAAARRRDAFARELDLCEALGRWWGEWRASRGATLRQRP